jgi:hypothetical protein
MSVIYAQPAIQWQKSLGGTAFEEGNSFITAMDMSSEFVYAACADNTIRSYPVKTSYFEKIFTQNVI